MRRRGCCINDLRDKDVINICDGKLLGCVDDVEVDICTGRLVSIIVPYDCGVFGFSKRDVVIAWENIERIGDDIILVKIDAGQYIREDIEVRRPLRKLFL